MKNLFESSSYEEIVERIGRLNPDTKGLWGKMNVSQMLAHCAVPLHSGMGEMTAKRGLLSRLMGPFFLKQYLTHLEWKKNLPTSPEFLITENREFESAKSELLSTLEKFHRGGPSGIKATYHPFFGKMKPLEWAQMQYNHMNHHLTQFGV